MFLEIIGWSGTILVVLAYFFVTTGKVSSKSKKYQIANLLASVLMGYYAYVKLAWASLGLQFVWGLIAIFGLYQYWKKTK